MRMRALLAIGLIAIPIILPSVSAAEIYRWRDANGKLHFSDKAPEQAKAENVSLPDINRADAVKIRRKPTPIDTRYSNTSDDDPQVLADANRQKVCDNAAQYYERLTRGINHNASSTRIVLQQDGETLSRREQNQYAERMRLNYNRQGCAIPQAENLRL